MRRSVLVALALLVVTGGCTVRRLDARHHLRLDGGPCGWNVVVDQNAVLWKAGGCENGYPVAQRVRRLKPDELARLEALMARLPRHRVTLTQAEYVEIAEVFETLARLPEGNCWLEVFLRSEEPDGTWHEWTVERCDLEGAE